VIFFIGAIKPAGRRRDPAEITHSNFPAIGQKAKN
jgi:hypothetical protein